MQDAIAAGRLLTLRSGQRLFRRDDAGPAMFIIIKGSIEVSLTSRDGKKVSLNVMEPGQCLGEISMIDGGARSADATAASASTLLAIPSDAFESLARKYPDLALSMARILSARVRWVSESVEDYALASIDRRLARRLLILLDRFGDADGTVVISQGDLADFAGATRETANRVLAGWRKNGWIVMHRKKIAVTARSPLDAIAAGEAPERA